MTFRFSSAHLLACFLALFFARTPALAQTPSPEVTGTVTYRERMALPADAVIDVLLLDTSVADVAAQTVAEVLINAEGRQVPVPFTLTYDPAKIVPGNRYSMRATIRSGDGMLMFSSTQAYPVLTHGAPSKVNLILHTVGHGAKPGATAKKAPTPAASDAGNTTPQPTSETPPASEAAPSAPATDKSATQAESKPEQAETATLLPSSPPSEPAAAPPPASASAASASPEPTPSETAAPTGESSSRVTAPETAPPPTVTAPPAPAATKQQAPPAEAPAQTAAAPEAESSSREPKPAESQPAAPAAITPTPEANATAPEPPLPEAPSASKHSEFAVAAPESAEAERGSDSRPARPAPNKALTPLADTQWKLIQLAGQDVVITLPQKPVTLAFSPEGKRIAGSAGCNSYIGTFTDTNGRLHLSPGNMTMMVCADPAGSRERKFVAVLRSADGYKISGDFLLLTSGGKTVAKFRNNQE